MPIVERITNSPKFFWAHKKKTAAALAASYFLGRYVMNNIKDENIRKFYCQKAEKFGQEPIQPDSKPRRLTVLVNTSASQFKVMDRFQKNALPLLHLSGIQVDIIKAESADQLESVASVLDKSEADAVYIVGGDGTLTRALTGIFKDRDQARLPIGIFPGGDDNRGLLNLVANVFANRNDIRPMCESAMAVIEERKKIVRPFTVEIISKNPEESKDLIYSLSDVAAGWYKHIEDYKHKFWYWGGLKRRWAYLWSMVKNSPTPFEVKVYYEEFCSGCKRCKSLKNIEEIKVQQQPQVQKNQNWWNYFVGVPLLGSMNKPAIEKPLVPKKDYNKIENDRCGTKHQLQLAGTDLIVDSRQLEDSVQIRFHIGGLLHNSRIALLRDGWHRCKRDLVAMTDDENFYANEFVANAVELNFQYMPKTIQKIGISGDSKPLENYEEKVVKIQKSEKIVEVYLPTTIRELPVPI